METAVLFVPDEHMKRASDVENFPFDTFDELRAAIAVGTASPAIDTSVAEEWALNGPYTPRMIRIAAGILISAPFVTFVAWCVWAASIRWSLLFFIPVFVLYWFIGGPLRKLLGPISSLAHLAAFAGLVFGVVRMNIWLFGTSLALLIIWFSQNQLTRSSVSSIAKAALQHEDLFCVLWESRALRINFANGDIYGVDIRRISEDCESASRKE